MARFYPHSEGGHPRRLAQRFEVPADRPIGVMSGGEQRKAATFFYKDTAMHSLGRILDRQDIPPMLRDNVHAAVEELVKLRG